MNVTVITPTTGAPELQRAIVSVQNQSVRCKHLVVIDGEKHRKATESILEKTSFYGDVIVLPENTGGMYRYSRWNGHRIYSGVPKLVNTDYICFLDEDNSYRADMVHDCEMYARDGSRDIVTCRRHLYYGDEYIGFDNFESIGKNELGYNLHDTNTMFFNTYYYCKHVAHAFYSPLGADKHVSDVISGATCNKIHLKMYLVDYYVPEKLYGFFKTLTKQNNQ